MRARSALVSRASLCDLCAFAATLSLACAAWGAGLSALTGTVRNSVTGLPVGHAVVRLVPAGRGGSGYLATTGPDGVFRFENIPSADYEVLFERSGFIHDSEFVHLADNETQLKLDATPLASIAGKVLDADGEPVPYAGVRVLHAVWVHGKRVYLASAWADANERGEFRIPELQPGRYRLAAIPSQNSPSGFSISEGPGLPESRLTPAYYPSGLDLDSAAAVDLEAGQELGGIEFKLSMKPSFHVRGTAGVGWQSWLGMPLIEAVRLDNGRRADWFEFTTRIGAEGEFDIAGVPPGVYALAGVLALPAAPQTGLVTVTSHDVNRVAIAKPIPVNIRVRVLYPSDVTEKTGDLTFNLESAQPSGWEATGQGFSQTQRHTDGSLVFEKVMAGTYWPVLVPNGPWYVQSMTYNGQPVTDAGIDVTNGSEAELQVMLAKASAAVDCKLAVSGGPSVVAVALDAIPGNMRVRQADGASDGQFTLRNLPPGHYLIFATEKNSDWPWENEDFVNALRDQAAAIDLTEHGKAHVELKVLSQETLRRAEERIP